MFGFLFGRSTVYPEPVRAAEEFRDKVLQSELPVIVNVWSETCAPCKRLKPVLVEVATAHAGKVRVVEISTSSEPALLAALRVQATPTILVFDGGEEVGRMTGFRPKGWFDDMIAAEL